jgi:hypothetical protein
MKLELINLIKCLPLGCEGVDELGIEFKPESAKIES